MSLGEIKNKLTIQANNYIMQSFFKYPIYDVRL